MQAIMKWHKTDSFFDITQSNAITGSHGFILSENTRAIIFFKFINGRNEQFFYLSYIIDINKILRLGSRAIGGKVE